MNGLACIVSRHLRLVGYALLSAACCSLRLVARTLLLALRCLCLAVRCLRYPALDDCFDPIDGHENAGGKDSFDDFDEN